MNKVVILFNGPPRSGKDTLAGYVKNILNGNEPWYASEFYTVEEHKFTAPMDKALKAFFDMSDAEFKEVREELKDEPLTGLFGKTMRSSLISLSETWAKVQYGQDVFGELLARKIHKSESQVHVITDCGFTAEVDALMATMPTAKFLLVQLYREGKSFNGDSRSYIKPVGKHTAMSVYNSTLPDLANSATMIAFKVKDLINE